MRGCRWIWLGLVGALVLLTPVGAAAQEPDAESGGQEPDVYQQAARLAAEGRWAEAADKYRAALTIRESATARFNLGQAERNLGRFASAKREFSRARELAAAERSEDVERLASQALAALAQRVPTVAVAVPRGLAGLEARIDGAPVATGRAIELDPGLHDLVVTATGREPFVRSMMLREGQRLRVAVSFDAPRAPPAPPVHRKRPPAAVAGSGPPIGPVLLAGVGAGAFTTAALFHIRRNDKLEDAANGCDRNDDGFVCPDSLRTDPEHRDAIDAAERAALARDVLIGVGVAAWGAGALWWVLDSRSPERPISATLSPSAGGASARVRVAF
jgi:tetratricopeptide (TPR) repeat protein